MMQEREHGGSDPFLASYSTPHTTPGQHGYSDLPPAGYSDYAQPSPLQGSPYTQSASQLGTDGGYRDEPGAPTPNYPPASPNNSGLLLPGGAAPMGAGAGYPARGAGGGASRRKKGLVGLGVLAALVLVAAAVVLPVYFLVIKKHNDASTSGGAGAANAGGSGSGNGNGGGKGVVGAITGGDGSTVVTSTGETFVYKNPFGGYLKSGHAGFDPPADSSIWICYSPE